MRSLPLVLVLLVAAPTLGRGQASVLDTVEARISAGDDTRARTLLRDWWRGARDDRGPIPEQRARALLLRARLAPTLRSAEPDYLSVMLGYPSTPYAPIALLRLGQGLLAAGDIDRSAAYLERLLADYPGDRHSAAGALWLARAYERAGRHDDACRASAIGLRNPGRTELHTLLGHEHDDCPSVDRYTADELGPRPVSTSDPAPDPGRAAAGSYAIQVGAFREEAGAERLSQRLGDAGYESRIVRIPNSRLLRVRVGRFPTAEDARSLLDRLDEAGFQSLIVRNANLERRR